MMNTHRALIALAGMMLATSIGAHAQAIEPHGNIGMPAPVRPAPGQNGAPSDGSALPEPELSLTKDGRAECVDWDRWSERPSVRCFYTITVKNNGSAPYWGLISVEDTPTGARGTVLKYRLAVWGLDTIWRRCLSTRTPGTGDTTPEGPFFCETHGGAAGTDGLAPGEEITLTIEVVVERQYEDFRFENCATLRWDWMRDPPGTDEAVRQRLGELGYVPLTWIEGASGDAFPTSSLALTAFQRDRGLPLTGEADEATLGALFPDGRWPFDANRDNDHDCHSNIIPTQFDRSSYEQRDGGPQPLTSCPPGWSWTGKKCDRASRKPSGTARSRFVPPAPPSCPKTMARNAQGQCQCAKGTRWDGQRCKFVVTPPKDCPHGHVGTPPYCKKVLAPRCPSGTIGTPPHCEKAPPPKCPAGMVGTPPHCKKAPPKECPKGFVGTPPNCKELPEKCPVGMIGTPPNCKKIEAPF
jgi:hypothetical protein